MHGGRPTGESFDHRPPGWIRQSRKGCTQTIHNHMVVDYLAVSSVDFAIPDFCSAGGLSSALHHSHGMGAPSLRFFATVAAMLPVQECCPFYLTRAEQRCGAD